MPAIILDGKEIANKVLQSVQAEGQILAKSIGRAISLVIISVGDREDSKKYINSKLKKAESLGFTARNISLKPSISQKDLEQIVKNTSLDSAVDGIILQLPIPQNSNHAIDQLDPEKDIDGLHPFNQGALVSGRDGLFPCTPLGVMHLIKQARIQLNVSLDLTGLNALVIGRSQLVGRPVAQMLLNENCTVTVCHSKSVSNSKLGGISDYCKSADIIVSATGIPGVVNNAKAGSIIIDVGLNYDSGLGVKGDVDFEAVLPICGAISPVPGGVGPMTVAMLMKNLVKARSLRFAASKGD